MKKLVFWIFIFGMHPQIFSQCNDFYFSEIVEGWSNNKAIEIYNPSNETRSLDGYGLIRFINGADVYGNITSLDGYSVEAHDVFVVVLDKRDSLGTGLEYPVWPELQSKADIFVNPTYDNGVWAMYFNGDDAIALVKNNGQTIVDLFGRIGEGGPGTGFFGWNAYATDSLGMPIYASKDHTMIRKASVTTGITSNPTSFDLFMEYDTLPANTFSNLGCHYSNCGNSPLCFPGCNNPMACNYNSAATSDDGSCLFLGNPCNDNLISTINDVITDACVCSGTATDLNGNNENTYQGVFYQAVARNANGTAMANQNVNVRFTLHQGSVSGLVEYQETQALATNGQGLFFTTFGGGQAVSGNYAQIQWGVNSKFLQVEFESNGWQTIGTQQLMAVPYAIRAKEVDPSGLKLQSPNGGCYILQVGNNGELSTLSVPCD
jgi:Lamin Tail Domain